MSSVVKYNRVVVNVDKKVMLHHSSSQSASHGSLDRGDESRHREDYRELVKKASQQAKEIISEAQKQAKEIEVRAQIEAAKAEKGAKEDGYEKGYSEGYAKGYEEGLMAGRNQGRKEYEDRIKESEQLKEKYIRDYENIYRASEENMLELAMDIARKIIGDAIDSRDNTCLEVAYGALKLVKGQRQVQLKVSSQDFPRIMDNKDQLISRLDGIEDIEVVEDAFLDSGSCIIDTGNGIIDGSVEAQLDIIEDALYELAGVTP